MTSSPWRKTLLATGLALAASSLMIAGCSKGDGDVSDAGGADPGAVTRATDSAEAGAPSPRSAPPSIGSVGGVVSTADTSRSSTISPAGADTSIDTGPSTVASSSPSSSGGSLGSGPGRATGPRQ